MVRIKILSGFLIVVFFFLIFGLMNLQIIQGGKFKELSLKNCIRLLPQIGTRGRILDRNGEIIVGSELSYDVMAIPQDAPGLDKSLANLAAILHLKFDDLKRKFKRGYLAPSVPVVLVENADIKKAIMLEELKPDLPGILVQLHPARYYPYGKLACHAIGYLNEIDRSRLTRLADYGYKTKDIVGFGGVEEKYDYYLRQEEGGVSVEVDHKGRFVRMLGFKPPRSGKDVQLTLDLRIQKIAEECLGDKIGSVIIMEPFTGEIIAMANNPGFNPAVFVKKDYAAISGLFNSPRAPLLNRATSGLFPAGSTFKPIVATAGLETGKITLTTSLVCTGSTYVGRKKFNCWDTHGTVSVVTAIMHSCNVFFYRTGVILGGQTLHDYALKFGFSKPTGFELPHEASGFVPDPLWKRLRRFQGWSDGDTANFAIGQGDLMVTPLQMVRMISVFANKGNLVTPYIVKAVDGQDITAYQRKVGAVPVQLATLEIVRKGLRRVVGDSGGTAKVLNLPGITVAGKTGTVQVARGAPHGWFIGFFPFEKPQYAICVFLEHGVAGYMAALAARDIIVKMRDAGIVGSKEIAKQ
jgi:penicillin-binding protein 2